MSTATQELAEFRADEGTIIIGHDLGYVDLRTLKTAFDLLECVLCIRIKAWYEPRYLEAFLDRVDAAALEYFDTSTSQLFGDGDIVAWEFAIKLRREPEKPVDQREPIRDHLKRLGIAVEVPDGYGPL